MFNFTLVGFGHLVLALVLSYDVLLTKQRPVSAVLWLGVVWVFPFVGVLAYLSFGMDRVRRGAAAREAAKNLVAQRAAMDPTIYDTVAIDESHRNLSDTQEHPAQHIFRATDPAVRPNRVLRGNHARLLVDGDQFFPVLREEVEKATSSIHVQAFIFGRDHVGHAILDLLMDRARAGVEVRLLYDRFGSSWAHLFRFFERAKRSGVRVCSITQASPLKGRFQINLRNHRKIVIIDGKMGFVGGINFQDDHLSAYAGEDRIRDYHVQLEGPAVADLQIQFVKDWYFASREPPEPLLQPQYFPTLEAKGSALVQIVPGGPELRGSGLADAFFGAIVAAEESVAIVTPYFVPDEPIVQGLRYAAMRGVEVKIVVPKRNNHWYTGFAAKALYSALLEAGVRIFERRPPFMHAKALVVDGVYAMLGSANLDYRSLHLNFETNLEVVDAEFVASVANQVEQEIDHSDEVVYDVHRRRPLARRLVENFCYLFQPML